LSRLVALALLLGAVAIGGCRDEEQGRPLSFDPGEYSGPAIPAPPEQAAQGWRTHVEKMKF